MSTVITPKQAIQYINMLLELQGPKGKCYIFMHFAEFVKLQRNDTREFTVLVNGEPIEQNVLAIASCL